MRHRCNIHKTWMILMKTLMINNILNVLISETLIFHRWFIDDFLKKLWCNIDETLMISIQTFMIIIVFNVPIYETLMFHWWFFQETLMISMETLKIINDYKHNNSKRWCFIKFCVVLAGLKMVTDARITFSRNKLTKVFLCTHRNCFQEH